MSKWRRWLLEDVVEWDVVEWVSQVFFDPFVKDEIVWSQSSFGKLALSSLWEWIRQRQMGYRYIGFYGIMSSP